MNHSFDVIVVGAGLVGASLIRALASSGLELALVDPHTPAPPSGDGWDTRIYAISPGNVRFLQECGTWRHVPAGRAQPVYEMQIFGDRAGASMHFSAYDAGLADLACIVENRLLQHGLWQEVQAQANVKVFAPAQCTAAFWAEDHVQLTLSSGDSLQGALVVAADGAESWLRAQAGLSVKRHDYHNQGVVANFETEKPHNGTAYQWFRGRDVLALLPLPGNRVSMVWSAPDDLAASLVAAAPEELASWVSAAAHNVLGEMRVITPAAGFPLALQRVPRIIGKRIALVGDAAHQQHPLAGQGVNLGFRDVVELAGMLINRGPYRDCGDYQLLRRYERARREDIAAIQYTTDGLKRLFAAETSVVSTLRNAGLRLVDLQPRLKNLFIRQAIA